MLLSCITCSKSKHGSSATHLHVPLRAPQSPPPFAQRHARPPAAAQKQATSDQHGAMLLLLTLLKQTYLDLQRYACPVTLGKGSDNNHPQSPMRLQPRQVSGICMKELLAHEYGASSICGIPSCRPWTPHSPPHVPRPAPSCALPAAHPAAHLHESTQLEAMQRTVGHTVQDE